MWFDANDSPSRAKIDADVCIVGAGPAGIVLGRELIGSSLSVVIIDSGGFARDKRIQELNQGHVVGDPYAPLQATRHRQVGGTTHLWNTPVQDEPGAKFVPLDLWDFEVVDGDPLSGWTIGYPHLAPYYRRSQTVCGLGPFAYEGSSWADEHGSPFNLPKPLSTRIYQFAPGRLFTQEYVREIEDSDNVRIECNLSVCGIQTDQHHAKVVALHAKSLTGERVEVRGRHFVLTAGAIENARLLLLSGEGCRDALGNRFDWVGRCLMEHPRDDAMTLVPCGTKFSQSAAFYDVHSAPDGTTVCGRIAFDGPTLRAARLPNASVTILPKYGLPSGWRAWRDKFVRRLRPLRRARSSAGGYGWSRSGNGADDFHQFQLLMNIEQRPQRRNRIVLSKDQDSLGVPRVEMRWQFSKEEQADLQRLRELVASSLEAADIGKVLINPEVRPDPNAHHHAGTTRLHSDACQGVVDENLRVHGTDNLYVAGASVFPTAGFANPTLTIVALSLRLADHLQRTIAGTA